MRFTALSRAPRVEPLERRSLLAAMPAPLTPVTEGLTDADGTVYYVHRDVAHGTELWKIDAAGRSSLVKDIRPGPADSIPTTGGGIEHPLTAVGNVVFFAANDGVNGTALWKSDGTAAGTVMVADLTDAPPNPSVNPDTGRFYDVTYRSLVSAGGKLFFAAETGLMGQFSRALDLWQSDGTPGGTRPVEGPTHQPLSPVDYVPQIVSTGDAVLTRTTEGLWLTDGTPEGTALIDPFGPLTGDAWPARFQGSLYYAGVNVRESGALKKVEGTASVTVREISDAFYSDRIEHLTAAGPNLFFDVTYAAALWKSDGTEAGTVPVATEGTLPGPIVATAALGDRLLFISHGGLFVSDGTPAGTVMLHAITGTELVRAGSVVYFAAPGAYGPDLWKTDGTAAGTSMALDVSDIDAVVPRELIESDGAVYFTTRLGDVYRYQDGENNWPVADAGGPYVVDRGGSVQLNAGRSRDPDGDALTYSWDVDGDGSFDDASGAAPVLPPNALGGFQLDSPVVVAVRVEDGHGHTIDSLPTTLTVATLPPVPVYAGEVVDGATEQTFTITYSDGAGVDVSSLIGNGAAVQVRGSAGLPVTYVDIDDPTNGSPRTVMYRLVPPGGSWDGTDNGQYTVYVQNVRDVDGNTVGFAKAGEFTVKLRSNLPDLTVAVVSRLAGPVKFGSSGRASVVVTNSGTAPAAGRFDVSLRLTTPEDPTATFHEPGLAKNVALKLGPGKSRRFNFGFTLPWWLDSRQYAISARVSPADAAPFRQFDVENDVAVGPVIELRRPVFDPAVLLAPGSGGATPVTVVRGRKGVVKFAVRNEGEAFPPRTILTWNLYLVDNPTAAPGGAVYEVAHVNQRTSLRPGATRVVSLHFVAPDRDLLGAMYLVVRLSNNSDLVDDDPTDTSTFLPAVVVGG